MTAPSPAEKRLQRLAAVHSSWAKTPDRAARMAPARIAAEARFEKQVDPDGVMTPVARALAASAARKAFYADMARKSAAVRRRKAAQA